VFIGIASLMDDPAHAGLGVTTRRKFMRECMAAK
jgi:hypothetical protein